MFNSFSIKKFSINREGHTYASKDYRPPPRNRLVDTHKFTINHKTNNNIYRRFRDAHEGHRAHALLDPTRASTGGWCTEQAYEYGFYEDGKEWANLGQGAPEVEDEILDSFKRPDTVDISLTGREDGPTAGIKPLREAVANLYNVHHRQGKASQYTWQNVCIVPGGRAGLTRIAAVLNNAYLGFFIPECAAYNEMLSLFRNVSTYSYDYHMVNIDQFRSQQLLVSWMSQMDIIFMQI